VRRPLALHLPAHGRGRGLAPALRRLLRQPPGSWDLPELPEWGGPLESEGQVAELQAACAALLGAERCWFGVNGASGLLQAGTSLNQGQVGLELAVTELRQKVVLLGAGVDALTSALPPQGPPIVASAAGLAQSVVPQVELIAPVANHGSGMAPNIVPIGLWLGVGVAVFLVRPRTIALVLRPFARMPKLFGKLSIPALVACTQAVVLSLILMFVLDLKIANPLGFAACMMVSVLAFLSIVIALSTIWGDAGKALAMILLAIQMASSGGVLPVELSGSFYAQISPWLPMTWVVRGLKASMFGAYEGDWVTPLMLMLAVAAVFLMVAAYFGRWDYRPRRRIPPALDL